MTISLHNSKLGQLPCSHKRCKQWLSLWPSIFYSNMNMPTSHTPMQFMQSSMQTQKEIKRKTPVSLLCICSRGPLWGNIPPCSIYTGVGYCSEKLAWIKCQPWSRFTLTGATVISSCENRSACTNKLMPALSLAHNLYVWEEKACVKWGMKVHRQMQMKLA